MPAPAKTSDAAIVAAARALIEGARTDFSMAAVAAAVGVQTPSLYKRFADRDALVAQVRRDAYAELRDALIAAGRAHQGAAQLLPMAAAYRRFALAHPRLYALIFAPEEAPDPATHAARQAAVAPVLAALEAVAGPERVLDAARAVTAYLHGHVTMLNAGAFKLGGDIDAAFAYGLDVILAGIAARGARGESAEGAEIQNGGSS